MNFMDISSIEIFLSFITLVSSSLLGLTIYRQNRQSWTNRLFFLLSFFISTYIVVNYISLHPPQNTPESQLFWVRMVMLITSWIAPTLFLLVNTFPNEQFTLKKRYVIGVSIMMILSSIAAVLPWVFKSIEYPNGEPVPVPGPGIPIFLLDFVGLFIVSFIILIFKYKKAQGLDKIKQKYFLFGVIISFSLMALTTVIFVVVLKTSAMVFLGPIYPVVLMASIFYAIVKHQMFNIKIFATKALVIMIWCILFAKIFLSTDPSEMRMDIFIFVLMIILGILLTRSVNREIDQKERLVKLARSLENANLRLQELDRQKTEFLSIASHQLRTPLSILKGYIELIQDGAYGKVGTKVKVILGNMDESNERLVKLVDEFLDISRIEQGRTKFVFEQKDMNKLIDSVVKELDQRAKDKGLEIVWKPEKGVVDVCMDEEKVRHVVFNFVDNAIKYSLEGKIKVWVEKEKDGLAVRVKDNGIGFEKTDQVNFFQKFYRGANVKHTNVGGTGLGIYVCRQFIEKHGGVVWAKSEGLGKGGEFGFHIPFNFDKKDTTIGGEK